VFRESAAAWAGRTSSDYPGYDQVIAQLDTMTIERVMREGRALIGSPASVIQQVRQVVDLFGDIEPSLSMLWGDLSYEISERSLRMFAEEVMPRF
jgi:alkanesulfonate monooxygenase SsuD/methylene tetrahydromethanopterin reductase-like flavin-dependent oxidoreductase (luciferase family)